MSTYMIIPSAFQKLWNKTCQGGHNSTLLLVEEVTRERMSYTWHFEDKDLILE